MLSGKVRVSLGFPGSVCAGVWGNPERANRLFCIWGTEVLAECGGTLMPVESPFYLLISVRLIGVYVMPVVSPFCLLIGGGLIDVDVMPVASKRIFAFFLYTKDTFMCPLCRDKQIPLVVAFSLSVWR